jgi:hypothetical protein
LNFRYTAFSEVRYPLATHVIVARAER